MESKLAREKLNLLNQVDIEATIRTIVVSMLANIINKFLEVHSMSKIEIEALQAALNSETAYVDQLITMYNNSLGVQPHAESEKDGNSEIEKTPDVE